MKQPLFVYFVLLCFTLAGCTQQGFSYDDALDMLVQEYNDNHTGFAEDNFDASLSTTSVSYRKLVNSIYRDSQMIIIKSSDTAVTCGIAYFNYEEVFQKVISDTSGFIHDVKNLYDLEIGVSEINEYVYDYLYLMILSCNKSTREIECSLMQSSTEPFKFISNEPIVNQIATDVNQLVYDCVAFAKDAEIHEESEEGITQEFSEMNVDSTYIMNYGYGETLTPISIRVTSVLRGQEAKEKALSVSANNSKLVSDNMVYLEYEVHNYSAANIVFTSNFYDCDSKTLELFTDDVSFVGINKSCNIASGSTIMVNDLLIVTHDGLAWYDKNARELYLLNQK